MIYEYKDLKLDVEQIIKRSNRHTYFRFTSKDKMVITTPRELSVSSVYEIIEKHYDRIIKILSKYDKNDDVIHLLGREYKLILRESNSEYVYVDEDNFYVNYKKLANIEKLIHKYYADILNEIIKRKSEKLIKEFNIRFTVNYQIKNTKSYFGECFYKKNLIVLATKLAKYDEVYIESVLYHEFAHFYVHNHQNEFYELLESHYPNYRKVNHELRKIRYNDKF
ncbi:MAG: SprT-like domain-containing protein [Acholeplasmatales bacterium]|nr:SprT-like domain-containing protein [Acholeplasmatales bacterium]